jgi:glycosyltransferase involved in cell wall biosynthesis
MKILIISRGFPTEKNVLNGNFEATQAFALRKLGHEVIFMEIGYRILYPRYIFNIIKELGTSHSVVRGMHVYSKIFWSLPSRVTRKWSSLINSSQLDRMYRQIEKIHGRVDMVHSHYLYITSYATILKKKYNLPLVCTEHWSKLNNNILPKYIQAFGNESYPYVDRIIAVSHTLADRIKQHFKKNSTVIYNMVDDFFFDSKIVQKRNDTFFKFISVGHLIYGKGHDVLIEAFAKAHFKYNVILYIVRDGEEKLRLQKQIDNFGLTDSILLLGLKNKNEISQLLCESDAFVLASRNETFGVVYIEAMAKGLPIIATVCGGPEEFVNEYNGLLIPVENVDELSIALQTLYSERNKYNPDAIIKQCKNNFSENEIAKKITSIYQEVLNEVK